jgi:ankyrin repeat protein
LYGNHLGVMTFDEAHRAIKKGDVTCLRKELDSGLNPNLSNPNSWTLLMLAAIEGNTSVGRLLIQKGADLDSRNKFRGTALSLAAHTGHPSFVKLLLQSGASLECYPFGNNLEVWLNWLGENSACPPKELEHIRELFDSERDRRATFHG